MGNYDIAKKEADLIDKNIIEVLQSGQSFRVEAGAGSGKTYSLNKVVDWLQNNVEQKLLQRKQKIACITYTNTAVNVIASRLHPNSSIVPSTIHSFAWDSIEQFQDAMCEFVEELKIIPEGCSPCDIKKVSYSLGTRYFEDGTLFLYHDDVIKLFVRFLDSKKFRRIFSFSYPIILIDEYQDSFKVLTDQFIKWFIEPQEGPQFGFFGDSWQTVYSSNGACGLLGHPNIIEIKKNANFRSQKIIVDALNRMRPELPQISASDDSDGQIIVITTNEYAYPRQTGYYKGELQAAHLNSYIEKVREKLKMSYNWGESSKTLMITHKMLANQQQYGTLLETLDDALKDEEDDFVLFFKDTVEPLYSALENNNITELYDVLKNDRKPIIKKSQKKQWVELRKKLNESREKKIGDVISLCIEYSSIIPIPPKVSATYNIFLKDPDSPYGTQTIKTFFNINYSEVIHAINFFAPNSEFSTDHGVKGEEYNDVLFVVGRGWNNYKFDEILYKDESILTGKDLLSYIRNRNLFYVCCSRPKRNLVLFITVSINQEFEQYLKEIFGEDTLIEYSDFIK